MATFLDGANLNFQQREGSGAAFILPENQAAQQYVGMMQQKRQEELLNKQAQAKQRQAFNSKIDKNISDLSPGQYSQRFNQGIQEGYNEVIGLAKQMQTNGVDPFTNPDFLAKRNELLGRASASKELSTQYNNFIKEYGKDPDKYENGKEILEAFQAPDALDKFASGEFNPGQLQRKYNINDVIKASGVKPSTVTNENDSTISKTANEAAHVEGALTSIQLPEAQYLIKKRGGDVNSPYPTGFPTEKEGQKPTWATDKNSVGEIALNQLENDPEFMNFLDTKGYDTSTPDKAYSAAVEYIEKQNKAIGSYVDEFAGQLSRNTNPEFKANWQARRFALQAENASRDRVKDGLDVQSKKLDIKKKQNALLKEDNTPSKEYGEVVTNAVIDKNKSAIEDLTRGYSTKGTITLEGDVIVVNPNNGNEQRIPLKDKERIKALIREAIPSNQYSAKVNEDVYKGEEPSRIKTTNPTGLLPQAELLNEDALVDELLKKYTK